MTAKTNLRSRAFPRRAGTALVVLVLCGAFAAALVGIPSLRGVALGEGKPTDGPAKSEKVLFYPNCLKCHGDPELKVAFSNGESLSLYVDPTSSDHSVHQSRLSCLDCHQRSAYYPHFPLNVISRREFTVAMYDLCKRCHFEQYTRTLDSVHFEAMAEGSEKAPVCTDCHGSHNVLPVKGSHTKIAQTCSDCHAEIYSAYAKSVHGASLEAENQDVPVCTSCHGVHNIHGAATASFRQASVDLCIKCHGDKQLMDKYGISSAVTKTYLDDFHGKTAGFYQKESSSVWPDVAVCTDCHGVHDIKKTNDPDSRVVKANVAETCRRCHKDASPTFPAAWLSHYEASLDKHPLVYLVQQYYRFLIPLMVVGLALNVGLDLWRVARNR